MRLIYPPKPIEFQEVTEVIWHGGMWRPDGSPVVFDPPAVPEAHRRGQGKAYHAPIAQHRILKALAAGTPVTVRTLVDQTQFTKSTVAKTLTRLCHRRQVYRVGKGIYRKAEQPA